MLRVYCTVVTPEINEMAEKIGLHPQIVNNLICVWQTLNNKPNQYPSEQELQELIKNRESYNDAFKYAIPYYTKGEGKSYGVHFDENDNLVITPYPKDTQLKDALNTLPLGVPEDLKSEITTFKELYIVQLYAERLLQADPDYDIQDNPNAYIAVVTASIRMLREGKKRHLYDTISTPIPANPQVESEQKTTKTPITEKSIEYTLPGQGKQTYTIKGTHIYNKDGKEVFKEDSVHRNRIFANLAVKEGRAVVVEYRDASYVVNNKGHIISVATGKMMQWGEKDGNRKAILEEAQKKFSSKVSTQQSQKTVASTLDTRTISSKTASFGVTISENIMGNYSKWLKENPNGIVAYRVDKEHFNTPQLVQRGIIGNPFNWQKYGEGKSLQMFYDWLTTGNNFGEESATEEYRKAIINKILSSPVGTPILYYKEKYQPSHATMIGYLINHKDLLNTGIVSSTEITTSKGTDYPSRTRENADWSDITMALFTARSNGETLTAQAAGSKDSEQIGNRTVRDTKDKYIEAKLSDDLNNQATAIADNLEKQIKEKGLPTKGIKLNIAGNGIYSFSEGVSQEYLNDLVSSVIQILQQKGITISKIRSGGQTGIDEAGIIAAQRLGIPNEVHTTADFKFRGRDGQDIRGEERFRARFINQSNTEGDNNGVNSNQNTQQEEGTPEDLPEIGIPEALASQVQVNKESPRAILSRQMSPQEITRREDMIARDFSDIIDDALSDMQEGLRNDIENEKDPLRRLQLSQKLNALEDPVKGRRAAITELGIEEILNRMKEEYQEWIDMDSSEIDSYLGKGKADYVKQAYQKVLDNFDLLFDEASSMIEQKEHLRITRGDTKEVQNTEDQEQVLEGELGDDDSGNRVSGNEGYTFKIRFVDPFTSIRAETRKVLSDIKQIDTEGNVATDDLGRTIYVREDFAHSALLASLNWMDNPNDFSIKNEDGTYSLPALENAAMIYPWINQVIEELEADPNLISVFYNDFRKDYISYWMQRDGKVFPMNSPIDYEGTFRGIQRNYESGSPQDEDSIFDVNLKISKANIRKARTLLTNVRKSLSKAVYSEDMETIVPSIQKLLNIIGFSSTNLNLTQLKDISNVGLANTILDSIARVLDNSDTLQEGQHYVDTVREPLNIIAKLVGKVTELDAQVTFRQGKNSYPSYAVPNYIETVFKKLLKKDDDQRNEYLQNEFGKYTWFKNKNGEWNNEWLRLIEEDPNVRDMVTLVNIFNIEGVDYENWSPSLIATGFMNMYFAIDENPDLDTQYGYYNFPIFSDTKMSTFVKFIKYTGDYRSKLIPLYRKLVNQELKRIRLVEDRAKKGIPPISNFDDRGRRFCFLPELNTLKLDFEGKEMTLLDIVRELNRRGNVKGIDAYIDSAISWTIDKLADDFISNHKEVVSDESLDKIKKATGVKSDEAAIDKIREYVWNQIFATSQMVQIVTTDLAYYASDTDFQKRFKEVYAAGTKLNTNSKYGRKTERTVYVRDNIVTSPTYIPLKEMFTKAYKEERITKMDLDSILYKFRNINSVDGQAYRSLSSYRSILDMLGRWTPKMEEAFDRLNKGDWDISDFDIIWQTIKPFVYGQVETPDGLGGLLRTPHQNKNSEFLLLATYQVLGTVLNNSPQLRGLNKFMETNNIDVVQFESAVKVGCSGVIDINVSPSKIKKASEDRFIEVNGEKYDVPDISGLNISKAFDQIKEYFDNRLERGSISQQEYNKIIDYLKPTETEVFNTLVENTRKKINDTDVLTKDNYNRTTVHEISYDDYMIAQPTPEHLFDVESIIGSQFRNLIYSDLPEDIEINLGDITIKGRDNVKRYYFSLMVENLLDSYKEVNEVFSSIETLQNRLLSIVKGNPKYNRDLLNALEIVEVNGRKVFNVPFNDKITSTKLEELLTSIFKNGIAKQYIKGASCILVSNFGFTNELEVVRREDGSIEAVECYLPAYSRKFYESFLTEVKNKKGVIIGYKIDYNKLKGADKKLLDFVGYRIPTEAKYSMLPLRIKGFLPQQNGSAIMLPSEITTLSGCDFDVDKLFMMLPEFKRDQIYDVDKAWRDFYNDPSNSDIVNEINKNVTEGAKRKNMSERDFLQLIYDNGYKKYDLSETAQERFSDWFKGRKKNYFVEEKFEVINYDHSKEPKDNSREQRNNEIINIAFQILTNKMVGEDSQSPGNFDVLKHDARVREITSNIDYVHEYMRRNGIKNYDDFIYEVLNDSLKNLTNFLKEVKEKRNSLTVDTFIYYHNQNMVGKVLVGIYANNTTMQAKFQGTGLALKDGFEFTIDKRVIKSLSDIYTTENGAKVKISKNCQQFSAASVDNVKDPVLAFLMQNKNTANTACFMLRAGMSIPEIGAFFNIPIVKQCIEETGGLRELSSYISNVETSLAELLSMREYKVKPINSTTLVEIMLATLESRGITPETPIERQIQIIEKELQLAKLLLRISKYGDALGETVQAYRADSPKAAIGRSVAIAKIQTLNIDRLIRKSRLADFPLTGIENIVRNNYITPDMTIDQMREALMNSKMPMLQAFYSLGIEFGVKKLADYFATAGDYANQVIDFVNTLSIRPLRERDVQTIYNALIQFALSDTELFGENSEISLEEKRNYYLSVFPKEFTRIVSENPDIAKIPFIQKISNSPSGIIMRDSSRNSHQLIDLLMNSADTLLYMDSNPVAWKLAFHLFNYAYFKEGLNYGPSSFSQYFSTVWKTSFPEYIDTLRELNTSMGISDKWSRFITQYYANNPVMAPTIVVPRDYYSEDRKIIRIPSKEVSNRNLVVPTPVEFFYDPNELTVYRLNTESMENEILQYDRISTTPGNLYDANKESNDMVAENEKYQKSAEKMIQAEKERRNPGVQGGQITGNSNPAIDNNEGVSLLGIDTGTIDAILGELDAAVEAFEEYSPEEGLKEEGLNPCKKSNGDNVIKEL